MTNNSSVDFALLSRRDKEAILRAFAAELGFILHPASGTIRIFQHDYIIARVPPQAGCVPPLLKFPVHSTAKHLTQRRVTCDLEMQKTHLSETLT